jgi:phosphatidylglycerol lysyltransferase
MKRGLLLGLLVVGFLYIVFTRLAQIRELARTLAEGRWEWVLAAALFQALYFVFFTASFQAAFSTVGLESRWRDLLPVTFGSYFVNVVAPSGGAAGAALFVDDAARRGQPPARAATALVLQLAADYAGVVLVLVIGLTHLYIRNELQPYQFLGALVMVGLTGSLAGVLVLGLERPVWLRRLLAWVQRLVARTFALLRRPSPLPADWAEEHAVEFTAAANAMRARPRQLAWLAVVALLAHLADLGTLYCLFLAFRAPAGLPTVVAGYAVAVLFWIISPTPQGIGIVEGAMTLALTSLGVAPGAAAVVTLTFRGLAFWLPFAVGFVLLRRLRAFGGRGRALSSVWSVRLAAILVAAMGVVNLVSAVLPSLMDRIQLLLRFSPLEVARGAHLAAALAGFALLVLASGLWRHKRVAWWLTLGALLVSAVSHLVKGLDFEEAIPALLLAVWLWRMERHFQARSDPPSVVQGLRALGASLAFTLTYGVIGFYLLDRSYHVQFGLWAALRQTIVMFTQFYDPGLVPITAFGRYFADSIYIVGAATFGYALVMLVRPVLRPGRASAAEHARAAAIVGRHGRTSLARLTLLPDKAYHFSPGGSVSAFTVAGRLAVALGDPIGPLSDTAAAVDDYAAFCARNDWQPVFYLTQPDTLPLYRGAGFEAVCVGHDAIVDLASFSLDGKAGKPVRTSVNRLLRAGSRAERHEPPLPGPLLDELRDVSDEWLAMRHGSEQRFAAGWFDDDYLRGSQVLAVHAPDGAVTAFANLVPEYQRREAALDLMRRSREAEPGTMDFLFVSLFEWARAQGLATLNLGLSPLAGVGSAPADPAAERALHYIYEHVNQFYNFKGLHEFKDKFHPAWSPRYLIYRGATQLPAAWIAVLRATTGNRNVLKALDRKSVNDR